MASSHHDRMCGAMLFCTGVAFCSSKQSLKLYEPPIDKQHKYEQNLKRIMTQSLVDVGLSITRTSDLFLMIVYTVNYMLQYCGCWWHGDATNEVTICYCIKPFNPKHPDLNTVGGATRRFAPSIKPQKIIYRSYKSFNDADFFFDLQCAPFHVMNIFDDADDMAWYTSTLISDVIDSHAPVKSKFVKRQSVPYMNSKLRKALYSRNMARNKFRIFGKK